MNIIYGGFNVEIKAIKMYISISVNDYTFTEIYKFILKQGVCLMNRLIRFAMTAVCAALLTVPLTAQEQAEPASQPAAAPAAEETAPEVESSDNAAAEQAGQEAESSDDAAAEQAEQEAESSDDAVAEQAEQEAESSDGAVAELEPEADEPEVEAAAAEPAEEEIYEEIPAVQAVVLETETECVKARAEPAKSKYSIVYSLRPELSLGLGRPANSIGGVTGFGVIHNNLYTGMDISGGAYYFGGDINVGILLRNSEYMRNIFGLSLGFCKRNTTLEIVNKNINETLGEEDESTFNFGGLFWKFLYGKQSNLDITSKFLFGYRDEISAFASYEPEGYSISRKGKFAATYSISIGYTIIKAKN